MAFSCGRTFSPPRCSWLRRDTAARALQWRDTLSAGEPDFATLRLAAAAPLAELLEAASCVRENTGFVTFSPKVFIPLTRLCRDACGYCTFVEAPQRGKRAYMSIDEVLAVAVAGADAGCVEALFTLGDAPELRHASARAELEELGYASTLAYVEAAAAAVLASTGLLPHINAGLLTQAQAAALRAVSVSQGLMLESSVANLPAHAGCVTKTPSARLATLVAMGEARVPTTTGILVGIGETMDDRIAALLSLRSLHATGGHIQEVIVQNFRAKAATRMAGSPEPPLEEYLRTVALARLAMQPGVSLQCPPNLQRGESIAWRMLLRAGINDWGGVSPGVTRDWVNPEAAWPELGELAHACEREGFALVPRLPVYPRFIHSPGWLSEAGGAMSAAAHARRAADGAGLARGHPFCAGLGDDAPLRSGGDDTPSPSRSGFAMLPRTAALNVRPNGAVAAAAPADVEAGEGSEPGADAAPGVPAGISSILNRAAGVDASARPGVPADIASLLGRAAGGGEALRVRPYTRAELARLFAARGAACDAVCASADALRLAVCGDAVRYVVNRNVNYTNVCTFGCAFCAFSKGVASPESLRGAAYLLPPEEVGRRAAEAWARGATEVCLQGGIHPEFNGDTYVAYVTAVKAAAPDIHVHAFSPLEVAQGAARSGVSVPSFLSRLKRAGLGSLPGTAAEILDDGLRAVLCPDKLSTSEWCGVVSAAHTVGLKTTSTIMFGHIEAGYSAWADHLLRIRTLALASPGSITEFVPLPFVHPAAPLFTSGAARRGPTLRECLLLHAVARLCLHGAVDNIQASWPKMGPELVGRVLQCGANDAGGVLMNESSAFFLFFFLLS